MPPIATTPRRIETLARALRAAGERGIATPRRIQELHADFMAADADGTWWTVGLHSGRWNRLEGDRWTEAAAPDELFIDSALVFQLEALARQTEASPDAAAARVGTPPPREARADPAGARPAAPVPGSLTMEPAPAPAESPAAARPAAPEPGSTPADPAPAPAAPPLSKDPSPVAGTAPPPPSPSPASAEREALDAEPGAPAVAPPSRVARRFEPPGPPPRRPKESPRHRTSGGARAASPPPSPERPMTPELQAVLERVENLERRARNGTLVAGVAMATALAALLVPLLGGGGGAAGGDRGRFAVVEAGRFVLRDAEGKAAGGMEVAGDGTLRMVLGSGYGQMGAAFLEVVPDGVVHLTLRGPDGNVRAALIGNRTPSLALSTGGQRSGAVVTTATDGAGRITLVDASGRTRFRAP